MTKVAEKSKQNVLFRRLRHATVTSVIDLLMLLRTRIPPVSKNKYFPGKVTESALVCDADDKLFSGAQQKHDY